MISQIQLGDLTIHIEQKNIKNIHLRVYPPDGKVKVSAPSFMSQDSIRLFLISKRDWIVKQQQKIQAKTQPIARDFIDHEQHYFKGERYPLQIIEHQKIAKVQLSSHSMTLFVRPDFSSEQRGKMLNAWYRQQLKVQIPKLIAKYEPIMGVKVHEFGIKQMKTKWGTCNVHAKRIWLNLDLIKKPEHCLEYVVVHEMVHLFRAFS